VRGLESFSVHLVFLFLPSLPWFVSVERSTNVDIYVCLYGEPCSRDQPTPPGLGQVTVERTLGVGRDRATEKEGAGKPGRGEAGDQSRNT